MRHVPFSSHDSTAHIFEQFGTLYKHNIDDKHPIRRGFESSTSEYRATAGPCGPNELSWHRHACMVCMVYEHDESFVFQVAHDKNITLAIRR